MLPLRFLLGTERDPSNSREFKLWVLEPDFDNLPSGVVVAASPTAVDDGAVIDFNVDQTATRNNVWIVPRIPLEFGGNWIALVGDAAVLRLGQRCIRDVHHRDRQVL